MFGFLCSLLTKFPLHFADIHRYIPLLVSYLCVGSFRKLRAVAVGVFFYSYCPSCTWLSHAQTTMPFPTLPCVIGVSLGSPLPTVHPPYHSQGSLPCSTCGTQAECLRWRVLVAPSTLCGSPVLSRGTSGLPVLSLHYCRTLMLGPLLPHPGLGFMFHWRTYQARYVRVKLPRRALSRFL